MENLITLSGAAVSTGSLNTGGARAVGGQFISIAGGIASGVEYQLDGANHMNYAAGSGNALPFPDALQEFNVRTSGLTADAGRGAGVGAVQVDAMTLAAVRKTLVDNGFLEREAFPEALQKAHASRKTKDQHE